MPIVRVFEECPDLIEDVPEAARLRGAAVRCVALEPGPWEVDTALVGDPHGALGFLVLDGMLIREIDVLGQIGCTELIGHGDVLRPWTEEADTMSSIPAESRWEVVVPARLAVLDRRFSLAIARWPEVHAALIDRAIERARSQLFQLSVCHLTRVESRLLVTLWHFADRWGRVTPRGVVVPLPLTHRSLASIVGARRPSVTTALGQLREANLVERLDDGSWLLRGEPPEELAQIRRQVALREAVDVADAR